jgi:hypothetical protein
MVILIDDESEISAQDRVEKKSVEQTSTAREKDIGDEIKRLA